MEKSKNQNMNEIVDQGYQRRAFFGWLVAVVGGGLIGGSLLKKIFSSGSGGHRDDTPIDVTVHPLAVPRTKEGSKPNA